MEDYYTAKLDFSTAEYDRDLFTVEGKENSIYAKIKEKKTTKYTIPMPDVNPMYLRYDGVKILAKNIMGYKAEAEDISGVAPYNDFFYFNFERIMSRYTANMYFAGSEEAQKNYSNKPFRMIFHATENTRVTLRVSCDEIKQKGFTIQGQNQNIEYLFILIKRTSLDISNWSYYYSNKDYVEWRQNGYRLVAYASKATPYYLIYPKYSWSSVNYYSVFSNINLDVELIVRAGAHPVMCTYFNFNYPHIGDVYKGLSVTNMEVSVIDKTVSAKNGDLIQVVTHKWWINALLDKILEGIDYNLIYDDDIEENYLPLLTSTDEVNEYTDRYIHGTIKDALQSVNTLFMTAVQIYGNTIRICKREKAYPQTGTPIQLTNLSEATWSVDMTHVYNKTIAGWDKGDFDDINGVYEALTKNTYENNIDIGDEKPLELIHPYYGSPMAIENYISEKANYKDKDNSKDKKIFIFACNKTTNSSGYYTLCRSYAQAPTGQFDVETYYNLPMSPMRILIAHKKYRDISAWRNRIITNFTMSERDANVTSRMSWESSTVYENATGIVPTEDILFAPIIFNLKTSVDFDSLNEITGENSYRRIVGYSSDIGTIEGWINKIAVQTGKRDVEQWALQAKEVE
jgi:effector-binding domain-containing protein